MKKARLFVVGLLLSAMLTGCSHFGNETTAQATVSQSEETTEERKQEKSEEKKNSPSSEEAAEKTTEAAETTVKETETETEEETTPFVPDFKDRTLALECEDIIELPDTLEHIAFSSSQPDVVSVDEAGTLTALAVGAADITVEIDEEPYTFEVVVTTPEISDTSITKIAGNTTQLFFYGTTGSPVFKSDNPAIASVDEKGVVTAEFTGCGQSTKIHALIDGKEFVVDVTVEPIPQLLSTYEISMYRKAIGGYGDTINYQYKDVNLTLMGNANEIMHVNPDGGNCTFETVLNVADGDYSSGMDYPLYRIYPGGGEGTINNVRIYLVGSSQEAAVMVKDPDGGEWNWGKITYTPCDGYGMIDFQSTSSSLPYKRGVIATVLIDGYTYTFAIAELNMPQYGPDFEERLPGNYVLKECSVGSTVVPPTGSTSGIRSNSRTFFGSSFIYEMADKIVTAAEDEAINYAVGTLFKIIF